MSSNFLFASFHYSVWLCRLPCDKAAMSLVWPQARVPRLTGHGFKAQHAAHEVREADSPGNITKPQGHQVQDLLIDGQTCRAEGDDNTCDSLQDDRLTLLVLCTLQRSRGLPSVLASCQIGSPLSPCKAFWIPPRLGNKIWGRVMENQSPSSHSLIVA